jgi:hypothetical protein
MAIIVVAVMFMLNNLIAYAAVTIIFGVIIFALWNIFLKNKEGEIRMLRKAVEKSEKDIGLLEDENEELRSRRLNVTEINHIIELSLVEIVTSFTRTYNEEIVEGFNKYKFIGALKVQIKAKYGIDLKEMKLYFPDDENVVKVANVNPRFLSFSSRRFKWEISELLEFRERVFGSDHWRSSRDADTITKDVMEHKRQELEDEIENKPEELAWITEPLKHQITTSLELILETSGRRVEVVEDFDEQFLSLEELNSSDKKKS